MIEKTGTTVKGYPVVIRCANLPAEIRNGDGVGGGRVIGWLPVARFSVSRQVFKLKFSLDKRGSDGQKEEDIQQS